MDSLTLDCYGTQVTTCGTQPSRMDFKMLPPQLTAKFKTNRKIQDCGFNIMVTCVDSSAYFQPGCSSPHDHITRREDSALYHWVYERGTHTYLDISCMSLADACMQFL